MFALTALFVAGCGGTLPLGSPATPPEPLVKLPPAPAVDGLVFLTEEYPPFSHTVRGHPDGLSVALLEAMFTAVGARSKPNITVLPWSEGYARALSEPGICLFSTTRTPERQPLFQWVGPIATSRVVVLARKGSGITLDSPAALAAHTYSVIADDVGQQLLLAAGVPADHLDVALDTAAIITGLAGGSQEASADYQLTAARQDPADFETLYVLQEGTLNFACQKDTDAALVGALTAALAAVEVSGERQRIIAAHLGG